MSRFTRSRAFWALFVALALVVAGCGDDDADSDPDPDPETETETEGEGEGEGEDPEGEGEGEGEGEDPEGEGEGGGEDPEGPMSMFVQPSPVSATLAQGTYANGLFPDDSVRVDWYQADGLWVAVYTGLDLEATGPVCPGNSLSGAAGFDFISNAPTSDGACEGFTTTSPDASVMVCDGGLIYQTIIPTTEEGTLFGSIEILEDDGFYTGGTSQAVANAGAAQELDLSVGSYLFGENQVVC